MLYKFSKFNLKIKKEINKITFKIYEVIREFKKSIVL